MNSKSKFVLLFSCIFLYNCCNVNKFSIRNNSVKYQFHYFENNNLKIRESPITNREYLIFLCWNIDVYGDRFPRFVLSLFPKNTISQDDLKSNGYRKDYSEIFLNARGILINYILNRQYLDFPLKGLSDVQLVNLYKWLSDRYNERALVDIGNLNYNFAQCNEDSFTLETFLSDQYYGQVKRDLNISWNDGFYVPLFRPPFKDEIAWLTKIDNKAIDLSCVREHKMNKRNILWNWNNYYFEERKDGTFLNFDLSSILIEDRETIGSDNFQKSWYTINERNKYYQESMILDTTKIIERNEMGKLPYSIIGDNELCQPIVLENSNISYGSNSKQDQAYIVIYDTKIKNK